MSKPNEQKLDVLTERQFVELVRRAAREAGAQNNLAAELGVADSLVSGVLRGRIRPTPQLAEAMGYERRLVYVKVGKAKS